VILIVKLADVYLSRGVTLKVHPKYAVPLGKVFGKGEVQLIWLRAAIGYGQKMPAPTQIVVSFR
jgi:hypothetical protein